MSTVARVHVYVQYLLSLWFSLRIKMGSMGKL